MMMMMMMRQGIVSLSCQDCGNQAKRDCEYIRCRTCCKGRGFECQTHINSTWIPSYRRRQRPHQQQEDHHNPNKRLKQNPPTASSSGLEVKEFPAQVSCPAIFRCVRVTSGDDNGDKNAVDNDEYAYQTSVNIGGHVFKGILYDQGPDQITHYNNVTMPGGEGNSLFSGRELLQQQNFITTNTTSAAAIFDSSSSYPNLPLNASIIASRHVALDP